MRQGLQERSEHELGTAVLGIGLLLALQAVALLAIGSPAICRCGYVSLWYANPSGSETSQHLLDWYSYTHVLHGFAFYYLIRLLAPGWSVAAVLVAAIALEAGWEVLENTPLIIDRYRQSAVARGYYGDSVVNSVADTLAAAAGVGLALRLPVAIIVLLAAGSEVFAGYMIRDSLVLNIAQLVYPSEALSRWQMGR
ncbi:MAG: DUF2585 family protein [Hyphomicrobiaceae bacterium]|nr:DUF2585 family protein [Hyphomicrobiaceae bacterium]